MNSQTSLDKKQKKFLFFLSFSRWVQFLKLLPSKERYAFFVFFLGFIGCCVSLSYLFYTNHTKVVPKIGGEFREGVVGTPRFINPIYSEESDVDRDLTELVFCGLMKYNKKGEIVPDIAKKVEIKEGGKIWEVTLKDNIFWHDGKKLTSDDVIFTLHTLQDPEYKSPLRANYLGVKIKKLKPNKLQFELEQPYVAFKERLTFKILPKHIWKSLSPQNFILSNYNIKPIGCGPYKVEEIKQTDNEIITLTLSRFEKYHLSKKPYISKIIFYFFNSQNQLIEFAKKGKLDGFHISSFSLIENLPSEKFKQLTFTTPRYFALFFNTKDKFLKNEKLRESLNYITDKKEILKKVFSGKGLVVHSPLLSQILNYPPPSKIYLPNPQYATDLLKKEGFEMSDKKWVKIEKGEVFSLQRDLKKGDKGEDVRKLQLCLAKFKDIYPEGEITGFFGNKTKKAVIRFQEKYKKEILEPWGFKKGTGIVGKTTRKKLQQLCSTPSKKIPLKLEISTVEEDENLKKVASEIKKQWENFGIEVEIKTYPLTELKQNVIKKRNFQILLFGEALGTIPDPYPFWHSSQKEDPGLNLSKYENKKIDELLEKGRKTFDQKEREEIYQQFQDILLGESPAIFLCSPYYLYWMNKKIKGVNEGIILTPAQRFSDIENWYIKTKRILKF